MSLDKENLLSLINEGKVDSRLKGYNGMTTHPVLNAERTFCIVCGHEHGWVSRESAEFIRVNNVIVVCDECEVQYGAPDLPLANVEEVG